MRVTPMETPQTFPTGVGPGSTTKKKKIGAFEPSRSGLWHGSCRLISGEPCSV